MKEVPSSSPYPVDHPDIPAGGQTCSPHGRILVHMCCGPCSIIPLKSLLSGRAEVWGFFHNPNIHPLSEFRKRLEAVKTLARALSLSVIYDERYSPVSFMKGAKARSGGARMPQRAQRCSYCYSSRLEQTARAAKQYGFEAFSTSLLYSKYQNHGEITELGRRLAGKYGIIFHYEDFRSGWQAGIEESRAMGLYRQKYCGCIYSKIERMNEKKAKAARTRK